MKDLENVGTSKGRMIGIGGAGRAKEGEWIGREKWGPVSPFTRGLGTPDMFCQQLNLQA